jgi:hypothetical protein
VALRYLLQFVNGAVEFTDEIGWALGTKDFSNLLVIPHGTVLPAPETGPYALRVALQVRDYFAGIVELVRCGDEAHGRASRSQVLEVIQLALAPRGLGLGVGISAGFDNLRYARAKFPAYVTQARFSALVLNGIMQKSGDGLILVATVSKYGGSNSEKMSDVRPRGAFAKLPGVNARGIRQSTAKPETERSFAALLGH